MWAGLPPSPRPLQARAERTLELNAAPVFKQISLRRDKREISDTLKLSAASIRLASQRLSLSCVSVAAAAQQGGIGGDLGSDPGTQQDLSSNALRGESEAALSADASQMVVVQPCWCPP